MTADTSVHRVTIYRDHAGEWRWRAKAANGETVAESGEGYVDIGHARDMADRIFPGIPVVTADGGPPPGWPTE